MTKQDAPEAKNDAREFEQNPYNPDRINPEDIMRIFFVNDTPILPVISNRGILLGILKKEDVISELSDIDRAKNQKIDKFITKLAKKLSFDQVLGYVKLHKEFITINLFGEVMGNWSRLELLAACESARDHKKLREEQDKDKEVQVLEWMIYLILEHIPRALYALNSKGKTIFYNSLFEELYEKATGKPLDHDFVEQSIGNAEKNEIRYRKKVSEEVYFYNKDLRVQYEKVPLISNDAIVGYLVFCLNEADEKPGASTGSVTVGKSSLQQLLDAHERAVLVSAIKENDHDLAKVAKILKISKPVLAKKIKKGHIKV